MISYWRSHPLFCSLVLIILCLVLFWTLWQIIPEEGDRERYITLQDSLKPPPLENYTVTQEKEGIEKHLLHPKGDWHFYADKGIVKASYEVRPKRNLLLCESLSDCHLIGSEVEISAQHAQYFHNTQEVILEEQVTITHPQGTLSCQRAQIQIPQKAILEGKIILQIDVQKQSILMHAERAIITLDEKHQVEMLHLDGPIECWDRRHDRFARASSADCFVKEKRLLLHGAPQNPVCFIDREKHQQMTAMELIFERLPDGSDSVRADGVVRLSLPLRGNFSL